MSGHTTDERMAEQFDKFRANFIKENKRLRDLLIEAREFIGPRACLDIPLVLDICERIDEAVKEDGT